MSGPVRPLGGAALKRARVVAGVTQSQLAVRANISIRTVRGLESGSIRHPHQQSLLALAKALGMSRADTDEFIAAWTKVQQAFTFTALVDAGHDVEQVLADNAIRTHDDYQDISVTQHAVIGEDRRTRSVDYLFAMRALNDGLDRRLVMWGRENAEQDLSRVRLTTLRNCTAGEPLWLPKLDLLAYELDMGRMLAADETHVFGYRFDFSDAYPQGEPADDGPLLAVEMTQGFRRALQVWVLQVQFDSAAPSRIWQFSGPPRRRRIVRQLAVDAFRSVHITSQNLAPGEYGIAWEW